MNTADAINRKFDELRESLMRKTGTVTATSAPSPAPTTFVVVTVDDVSMTLPRLASYTPTLNDKVQIDVAGGWLILGKVA